MENKNSEISTNTNSRANLNEDQIIKLEKQAAIGVYLQTIGQIVETYAVSKLFLLGQDSEGEKKILTGVWVQVIGQILESIGVTKELSSINKEMTLEGQRIAVDGNWLQSLGSAIEAIGGEEVLTEELQQAIREFIP